MEISDGKHVHYVSDKTGIERIREAIDIGGGQTCDIDGVLRELDKAGFSIVSTMYLERMYKTINKLEEGLRKMPVLRRGDATS